MTTSLHRPGSDRRRGSDEVRNLDSFEIIPDGQPSVANGVLRSTWYRPRRVSTWYGRYVAALLLVDFLSVAAASATSISAFRDRAAYGFSGELGLFHTIAYLLMPLLWLTVLWGHGSYERRYLGAGTDEFKRVVRASWTVVAIVSFLALTTKQDVNRPTVGWALLGALAYILILRYLARKVLYMVRRRGRALHRMVLVGTLPETLDVYTAITRNKDMGLVPVGIHLSEGYAPSGARAPVPLFAGRDIPALIRELGADTVAFCGSASGEAGELRRLAWQLEGTGVDLVVVPRGAGLTFEEARRTLPALAQAVARRLGVVTSRAAPP